MKFNRLFSLSFQSVTNQDNYIIIQSPTTIKFNITKGFRYGCATANIMLYNLSKDHREQMFYNPYITTSLTRSVILNAGYQDKYEKIPRIFTGILKDCFSYRSGQDWITQIVALDGGDDYINSTVNLSIEKESTPTVRTALTNIIRTMNIVKLGAISASADIPFSMNRGITFYGNAWDICKNIWLGNLSTIEDQKAYFLDFNNYIKYNDVIDTISSETGLLGTPRVYQDYQQLSILFEPKLKIGQLIKVDSHEGYLSGDGLVMSLNHSCTISESIQGEARTMVDIRMFHKKYLDLYPLIPNQ